MNKSNSFNNKKLIMVLGMVIMVCIVLVIGVVDYVKFRPKFNTFIALARYESSEGESIDVEASELSEEDTKEVYSMFTDVAKYYGVFKPMPKVMFAKKEDLSELVGGIEREACYTRNDTTIYLSIEDDFSNLSLEQKNTIAHEYLHYLSDNGERRGFIYYSTDAKGYSIEYNRFFNEGATEYLAEKFTGYDGDSPYKLHVVLAEQIATVVGEETFEKAYLKSNDEEIRNMFNDNVLPWYKSYEQSEIIYDAWDSFGCACFPLWAGLLDEVDSEVIDFTAYFVGLEEEVMFFAKNMDKEKEAKEILSKHMQFYGQEIANKLFEYSYLMGI